MCMEKKRKKIRIHWKPLKIVKERENVVRDFTEAIIDRWHNYFRIALRSNLSTVVNMANAIWASFFHVASREENNFHLYCEISATSWAGAREIR